METEVFKAVCPLEIGDTVAIGAGKTAVGVRTAYYLPAGMEKVPVRETADELNRRGR